MAVAWAKAMAVVVAVVSLAVAAAAQAAAMFHPVVVAAALLGYRLAE
jgi:hypothetical protein